MLEDYRERVAGLNPVVKPFSGHSLDQPRPVLALTEVQSDGATCLWFDATDALRRWVTEKTASGVITVRGGGDFKPEDVYLEIAFAGKLTNKPQQVTGLKAFHHHGQTFLSRREIEDIAAGNEEVTWGEMVEKVRDCNPMVGIIPKWRTRWTCRQRTPPGRSQKERDRPRRCSSPKPIAGK